PTDGGSHRRGGRNREGRGRNRAGARTRYRDPAVTGGASPTAGRRYEAPGAPVHRALRVRRVDPEDRHAGRSGHRGDATGACRVGGRAETRCAATYSATW